MEAVTRYPAWSVGGHSEAGSYELELSTYEGSMLAGGIPIGLLSARLDIPLNVLAGCCVQRFALYPTERGRTLVRSSSRERGWARDYLVDAH